MGRASRLSAKGIHMAIDETRPNAFMGNFAHDLDAVMHRAGETPFNLIFNARP